MAHGIDGSFEENRLVRQRQGTASLRFHDNRSLSRRLSFHQTVYRSDHRLIVGQRRLRLKASCMVFPIVDGPIRSLSHIPRRQRSIENHLLMNQTQRNLFAQSAGLYILMIQVSEISLQHQGIVKLSGFIETDAQGISLQPQGLKLLLFSFIAIAFLILDLNQLIPGSGISPHQ